MALIRCLECGRDVSDQASACPNCGAPVDTTLAPIAPNKVTYNNGEFDGTSALIMEVAKSAVSQCNYRIDSADAVAGTLTFTTGVTMGSWSGVSGTIAWQETAPYRFKVTGHGKQNVKGGQVLAINLFDEANAKSRNVIEQMMRLTGAKSDEQVPDSATPPSGCLVLLVALAAPALAVGLHFLA
ncbi:MAG: zinc-ribbon domain-containing protein [Novosphingobium sp.]|uniref:hypothetical protein n=1 Tax=Novosphingobium sp. TaxID=1874826 RepID=UPI003C7C7F15